MIIALTGPMGSGKSTVTKMLQELAPFTLVKFAQPLYDIQKFIYDRCGLEHPIPKDRKLLQWLGTEWGREKQSDLWVSIWKKQVHTITTLTTVNVICDDCRFDNEAEAVRDAGGIVVSLETSAQERSNRIQIQGENHASEAGINSDSIDYVLSNIGTLEGLQYQVREMYSWFN